MLEVIPAIDIIGGRCVRLVQGDFSQVREYSSDPLEIARTFEGAGLHRLHLVDLDGARTGSTKNLEVLESVARETDLVVDFSGGLRSLSDIERALSAGATYVCIGSLAATDPKAFVELLENFGGNRIILAADTRDGMVAVHGWKDSTDVGLIPFLRTYLRNGGVTAMVTDISLDGLLRGPSVELYGQIRAELPELELIASGGVTSLNDLGELERIGCSAAIVGKAIYERRISLDDIAANYPGGGNQKCLLNE